MLHWSINFWPRSRQCPQKGEKEINRGGGRQSHSSTNNFGFLGVRQLLSICTSQGSRREWGNWRRGQLRASLTPKTFPLCTRQGWIQRSWTTRTDKAFIIGSWFKQFMWSCCFCVWCWRVKSAAQAVEKKWWTWSGKSKEKLKPTQMAWSLHRSPTNFECSVLMMRVTCWRSWCPASQSSTYTWPRT